MEDTVTFALSGLSLFGLWWLYFIEYKKYRLDKARQEFFSIRDELFENWRRCSRSFDEPAYGMMRTTLNGMTHFAHKLSAIRLIVAIISDETIAGGNNSKQFEEAFSEALSRLTPEEREYIKSAREKMHDVIINQIVFSSLFLTSIFFILFVILATIQIQRNLINIVLKRRRIREGLSMLDAEAERLGHHQFAGT